MDPLHQCPTEVFQLPEHSPVYDVLLAIKEFYKPIHTYLSIVLCALGAICNFCNIVVLTRKQMRSPVNLILCAMACCDTVVLFSNLIYTTHYTFVAFDHCVPRHWSYGWCVFLISHAHLSLVGHSSSIWLSVMLALIRYVTLRRRGKSGGVQIGLQHSYIAIACVVVFVSLMNAPNFLTYKITEQTLGQTCGDMAVEQYRNHTAYVPGVADIALEADCFVFRLAFWITGAVFKLFPCLLLTVLVSLLMRILNEVRANRQRLFLGGNRGAATFSTLEQPSTQMDQSTTTTMENLRHNGSSPLSMEPLHRHNSRLLSPPRPSRASSAQPPASPLPSPHSANDSFRRAKSISAMGQAGRTDRTTRMLLAIVCVFLVTELPQGIMAVMSGMFSEEFHSHIYNSVGDILDLLSLCNACTSFIIYCTMSAQFRNEFRRVFLPATSRIKCWRRVVLGLERRREAKQADGPNCRQNGHLRDSAEMMLEGASLPSRVSPALRTGDEEGGADSPLLRAG